MDTEIKNIDASDFEEKTYYTAMCAYCNCSIDVYTSLNNCNIARCDSCGQVFKINHDE